jgi:hypothetical protein
VQEREDTRHEAPTSFHQTESTEIRIERQENAIEDEVIRLRLAVGQLLDALERCAGDPPDCPHCGSARSFAEAILKLGESATQEAGDASEEKQRLKLSGRVGADPSFRVTPKGTVVARFPLAVHNADNTTTGHQVLASNLRAEHLRDTLAKGDAVQVVGYTHARESRGRDGQAEIVKDLYAVTVTPRDRTR